MTEDKNNQVPETPETENGEPKKKGFKVWWQNHKPTKRRLIQLYAALLFNVNFKGFFTGRIYTGDVKGICVPGMNCYSCPGASGACPLGSLQNALAHSGPKTETPNAIFYVIGIIILYGLLLGRTICGFLCPVGLGQELLYKIKTPKLKKSRVTRILSYFKYVLLAVLVIGVPLVFMLAPSSAVVPGFCKYVCPAGTFGGAIGLLLNPANADLYAMLGPLFTWKFVVLVVTMAACVFIFRFFCRFMCPLGGLYGFFNKIALLGVKLDKNKCTDCGLCVSHCKMDIKHVGDHECINCGECIRVCPAKAIRWKGSKLFLHKNAVEAIDTPAPEEKPLGNVLSSGSAGMTVTAVNAPAAAPSAKEKREEARELGEAQEAAAPAKKKRGKSFWLQVCAWTLALIVFAGAFVYYNFIDGSGEQPYIPVGTEHLFTVQMSSGAPGTAVFTFVTEDTTPDEDGGYPVVEYYSGDGTKASPYVLRDGQVFGTYVVETTEENQVVWFSYTTELEAIVYITMVTRWEEEKTSRFDFTLYGYNDLGALDALIQYEKVTKESIELTNSGIIRGYTEGCLCYDFSLDIIGGNGEKFTLSEHRGKIVVVNFWYTTCGPCVAELPEFQQIHEKYAEFVDIVAIHRAQETEAEIQNFINSQVDVKNPSRTWKDWTLTFARDIGRSDTNSMLGGKDAYPMTLIIDENGFVAVHRQGSVTYEVLELTIESLLNK